MDIYSITLSNVIPLKLVTARATYGIGFLTSIVSGICAIFGIRNSLLDKKLEKAEAQAMSELTSDAQKAGAIGIMDFRCQISGLSVVVSGTAYQWTPEEKAKREAEEKAKRETEEKAKREAEEKAKRETEEKAKREEEEKAKREEEEKAKREAEREVKGIYKYKCQLCEKGTDHLTGYTIVDDIGTRYRLLCPECLAEQKAEAGK
jgi:uncharacterized protein YbjQ (UPF0145 family)